MKKLINNSWDEILKPSFEGDSYKKLRAFLIDEYKTKTIYPVMDNIFSSLKHTPPEEVKVVILGQDPYIKEGQAHGMAFSVMPGIAKPPSLVNIFKELSSDIGCDIPEDGCLIKWAQQGVLLLNTVLTVRAGLSNSHANMGWEEFTDEIIAYLGKRDTPTVFMLWGRNAQSKEKLITNTKHFILKAPHPSPLSAYSGFFGCKHFSASNKFLEENNIKKVNW